MLYLAGDNSFDLTRTAQLELLEPTLVSPSAQLVAACSSQAILRLTDTPTPTLSLVGLQSSPPSAILLDPTNKSYLGKDQFEAVLARDGHVIRVEDGARSELSFAQIEMNGKGELLAVSGELLVSHVTSRNFC